MNLPPEQDGVVEQAAISSTPGWRLLVADLPVQEKTGLDGTLRIRPVACPAVVEIAEMTLRQPATREIVWRAATKLAFDELKIAGTAVAMPHKKHLRLLSFGDEPQLVLPFAAHTIPAEPLRLEISLFADATTDTVNETLAIMKTQPCSPAVDSGIPSLALTVDDNPRDLLRAPLRIGENQIVRFENVESLCSAPICRLRLRPLYCPAFLKIVRIVLIRQSDGAALFTAASTDDFNLFEASEGAVKRIVDGILVLVTHEGDYLRLPRLEIPAHESYRLEIQIEPLRIPPLLASAPSSAVDLSQKDALKVTISHDLVPSMEGLSLNAIEFPSFGAALTYALTHPRKKAAVSDHQDLIHAVARPLPDTVDWPSKP